MRRVTMVMIPLPTIHDRQILTIDSLGISGTDLKFDPIVLKPGQRLVVECRSQVVATVAIEEDDPPVP